MKKSLCMWSILAAVLVMCGGAINAFAAPIAIQTGDRIQITGLDPAATIPAGRGGPYQAFSPDAKWGDFITFCLEVDEYVGFNSTYLVAGITTIADRGGVNTDAGDELSPFTAYLYTKAVGKMYRPDQLDEVQYAIWFEENEIAWDVLPQEAKEFYALELKNSSGWSGLGNVRVINLTDACGAFRQDLLVTAAVPEPASLLLLGAGLMAIGCLRRKFRRQ